MVTMVNNLENYVYNEPREYNQTRLIIVSSKLEQNFTKIFIFFLNKSVSI